MIIFELAVPTPLYSLFDYISDKPAVLGARVKIPWRNTQIVGIVINIKSCSDVPLKKLKKIIEIIDNNSLFSASIFKLITFSADYYHYPIGEVFSAALPALLKQGHDAQDYRKHYTPFESLPEVAPVLTLDQEKAVKHIRENRDKFKPFLLLGVTGSGKTEVYLQLIADVIKQDKQALILVPEIGLTPQTVMRFQARFGVLMAVLHSGLSDRERHDAWLQAKNGEAKIIIGTRSAIFVSLHNPGIIIVDEEHDVSFKQQDGFRYSARDLAVVRAQFEQIPLILGSATPSFESLHNVNNNRYELLTLPERAGVAVQPVFNMIDLRQVPKQGHKKGSKNLSALLLDNIKKHLESNNQVLIFLNRRGFAPTLICYQCGWIAGCRLCDANMTLHQSPNYLQCHHCGATRSVDKKCQECQGELSSLGMGTQRIEEAMADYFPKIPVIRIDRDSTRKKGSFEKKLASIHEGEPCILVGTQMLAKGHHFTEVTLVVILDADAGLFSSDFRGPERTAQLIIQVAGRAGRVEKPGEVILQTHHPDHALLKQLLTQGYYDFAQNALKERKAIGWPPYEYLSLIRAESSQLVYAMDFLKESKALLYNLNSVRALGPIPPVMQKKAGKHRAHLLIQSSSRPDLKKALDKLVPDLVKLSIKFKQRVRWSIDVDPVEFF